MINLTIDRRNIQVEDGTTIWKAAERLGIMIPNFCYDQRVKDLDYNYCIKNCSKNGDCKLCAVEVEGLLSLPTACSTKAEDKMVVWTESPAVRQARKEILLRMLASHPMDCMNCQKLGNCKLQAYCRRYAIEEPAYVIPGDRQPIDNTNKFYYAEMDKCISCGRCVRTCRQLMGIGAITMVQRGISPKISPPYGDKTLEDSACVSCGNCVSVCPVGALMPKFEHKFRYWETHKVPTTCSYCGVGCQMNLIVEGNKVVDVEPAMGPSNEGLLCVKGKFAFHFIGHKDRLHTPLIREDGHLRPASWEEAIGVITAQFKKIKHTYGPEAIAGFSSARATNEENYLFQKFMRCVIGTNNVDHCARLCHSSTVAGLAESLGSGAMTNGFTDVRNAEVIFVTGSNTTEAHPVMGALIRQAKRAGKKLIVADPVKIPLAKEADIFLQIKPGTSVALSNGMIHHILEQGLENRQYIQNHTEGFEELKAAVKPYTPQKTAEICGVNVEDICNAAELYAAHCSSIIYSMGITQHINGTDNVLSISNLALITGNLGKSGTGVNPLRGQNNVQGACDMGCLPGDFPAYQKVADPQVRAKFEAAWGAKLSDTPGLTVTDTLPAVLKDQVKMLYIMGENPAVSDPDSTHAIQALEKAFLVVQDIFLTETAQYADVVLPAACFAEKDGTFTNSERRVQRIRKAVDPPGLAKADWEILRELFCAMDYSCNYDSPSQIMDEIGTAAPSYRGIHYSRIEKEGLCWPCLDKEHPGTQILHQHGPVRGKGRLYPLQWQPSPETGREEYPLTLITGRVLVHYHTRTMTARNRSVQAFMPDQFIKINPQKAEELGIAHGEHVRVISPRGAIVIEARLSDTMGINEVFIPFHWKDGANVLTDAHKLDPKSKIPGLKQTGVRVEKLKKENCKEDCHA